LKRYGIFVRLSNRSPFEAAKNLDGIINIKIFRGSAFLRCLFIKTTMLIISFRENEKERFGEF
jgi:hypothetical protein